jgi:hypothetical protein
MLPEKNLRLKTASKYLSAKKVEYSPPKKDAEVSFYYSKILEGASLVPRTLWFVRFVSGEFGPNPDRPSVTSLVLPDAKEPWKDVILSGEIEKAFIFVTVTGKYVLPFKAQFLPIVLPIEKDAREFNLFSSKELRKDGKLKMANWLDEAANAWRKHATKTSLKNFPEPMDRVNYHNGLLLQKQNIRYFVIYTGSGTHIAAAVIDSRTLPDLDIGKTKISPSGFVADYKTYWFGTNNADEAYYIAAILNSQTLDQMIKPHQSRGKFGPRDICRLPFELNFPQYDPKNKTHKEIASLGLKATKEAAKLPRVSRSKMKAAIPTMKDIDRLVPRLMSQKVEPRA